MTNSTASPAGGDLHRGLGLLEATTLIVGGTIGASIFAVPAGVANAVAAPGLALVAWGLTGLMALCGALSFAELAAAMPETGGTYVFLKRAYPNTPVAFLFGWMMLFTWSTGAIAVVASIGSLYAGHFLGRWLPYGTGMTRLVAVVAILSIAGLNLLGVRLGGRIQNGLTAVKVGMLVLIVVLCFASAAGDATRFGPLLPADRTGGEVAGSLATSMILSIFSYSGWFFVTHVAGEVRDPGRVVPRAIIVSMTIVLVIYLLLNAAFIYVLPFEELRSSATVAKDAVARAVGTGAADITALVVLLSTIGTLNAQLLNYPRITFALAKDGLFFERIGRIDPTRRAPSAAIVLVAVWASVLTLLGTYTQIMTYISFVSQLFMALTVVGLFVLRRREPSLARPYRVTGYPVTPLLYLGILVWYLGTLLTQRLTQSLLGVAIVLTGVPFYLYWQRRRLVARPS